MKFSTVLSHGFWFTSFDRAPYYILLSVRQHIWDTARFSQNNSLNRAYKGRASLKRNRARDLTCTQPHSGRGNLKHDNLAWSPLTWAKPTRASLTMCHPEQGHALYLILKAEPSHYARILIMRVTTSRKCPRCGDRMERIPRNAFLRFIGGIVPLIYTDCCGQKSIVLFPEKTPVTHSQTLKVTIQEQHEMADREKSHS